VVLPTARLDEIAHYQPYDVILLDVRLAREQQHDVGERA
jgi:hypothetical protein